MNIGLIDVDGHNFPNLALMRLSAWHKFHGDSVEWWDGFKHYDRVYMSKVFTFSPDVDTCVNADEIITGGTGYKDYGSLPDEVERISGYIRSAQNNPDSMRAKMIRGEEKTIFVSGGTWEFLIKAPFKISDRCCDVMKKHPMNYYAAATGWKAITAEMATESMQRREQWERTGCNAFQAQHPKGKPMSFWTEQDVLHFLLDRHIPFASVYGEIVASDGENDYDATLVDCPLHCTGCQRTGCCFCGFGSHLEKSPNRYEMMKLTHPKHYQFCIGGGAYDTDGLWKPTKDGLGYAKVLDYIGVRY